MVTRLRSCPIGLGFTESVEKWFGIHGSSLVYRYEMLVEENGDGKRRREIWIKFAFSKLHFL